MANALKDLRRAAEQQGWTVEASKGGHWKFIPPDKTKPMVVLPGTSVSRCGMRNALSALRRSGLELAA